MLKINKDFKPVPYDESFDWSYDWPDIPYDDKFELEIFQKICDASNKILKNTIKSKANYVVVNSDIAKKILNHVENQ